MLTSKEVISFLTENKVKIKNRFHCIEIGLFGSYARNEQTDESDIDILVEFEPNTPNLYHIEYELKAFLESEFNRKVDICAQKWIKPVFRQLVLNEAVYA